jgi:hypothetical protein
MLIVLLCIFEFYPGPVGKVFALNCLVASLLGITLTAFRPGHRLFVIGLAMLFMPLGIFEYHPGPAGKIFALRCMVISLIGVALTAISLANLLSARGERLKDTSA